MFAISLFGILLCVWLVSCYYLLFTLVVTTYFWVLCRFLLKTLGEGGNIYKKKWINGQSLVSLGARRPLPLDKHLEIFRTLDFWVWEHFSLRLHLFRRKIFYVNLFSCKTFYCKIFANFFIFRCLSDFKTSLWQKVPSYIWCGTKDFY